MAAIVANTLRRRTFRQKLYMESKFQAMEQERIYQTQAASSSRSSSIVRGLDVPPTLRRPSGTQLSLPQPQAGFEDRGGVLLNFVDFWPSCCNAKEGDVRELIFESFDTLIPKANAWLHESMDAGITLKKCETILRSITSLDDVRADTSMNDVISGHAVCLIGLRVWFTYDDNPQRAANDSPCEVGYLNVIPKISDYSDRYPLYEQLPDTYSAINKYLSEKPLDGKILTIETVALRIPAATWTGPELDPDKTFYHDNCSHHICHVTRIFFVAGATDDEVIGAQDFLPQFVGHARFGILGKPRYAHISTALTSLTEWMSLTTNIRVTNIQTLEAAFSDQPDNVNTGLNFVAHAERHTLVKFVRVTFVRPRGDAVVCETMYSPPAALTYRTFVPAPVKVHMCSGRPEYETFTSTWDRAEAWIELTERRIVAVESFYHPLNDIWHKQDRGETAITNYPHIGCTSRRHMVHVVRVYLDGAYNDPDPNQLPPLPTVHEVNDCRCNIV